MSDDIPSPVAVTEESRLLHHGEPPIYGTIEDLNPSVHSPSVSESSTLQAQTEEECALVKPALRDVFTKPLLNTLVNHGVLAYLDMCHSTLLPLMYSTSIPLGGLGLDPFEIGLILGGFGCLNAIVQTKFLGRFIRKYGARKVYMCSFAGIPFCFLAYPIMSFFAKRAGRVDGFVIVCMSIQLCCQAGIYTCYGK